MLPWDQFLLEVLIILFVIIIKDIAASHTLCHTTN